MNYKEKYEKAYKDALERAREELGSECFDRGTVEYIFPELKESEGEWIRKELIEYLNDVNPNSPLIQRWIAWLKKQSEKSTIIDVDQMVTDYSYTKDGEFGLPVNCMIRAYRKGINDVLKLSLNLEKQGEPNKQHLYDIIIALWDLLDKIDTFSDLQINDTDPDNPFRKIEDITQERHKFVKSDGYDLFIEDFMITNDKNSEKQGEQKPHNICDTCEDRYSCVNPCPVKLVGQKSAEKVEAKQNSDIEKGKWYVCDTPRYVDFAVGKAYYCPNNGMLKPNKNEMARYVAKHCFHPWTIQDAKDGDVLAIRNEYFLFKDKKENTSPAVYISHCFADSAGAFRVTNGRDCGEFLSIENGVNACPATKEQRDILFQKMKEAGYEWDADKKELRKIEQNPAWSEEDERMLKEIVSVLEGNNVRTTKMLCEYANWLKSLKPQPHWKPTEEQIEAVKCAAKDVFESSSRNEDLRFKNEPYFKSLYSLYEQLKKL